MDYITIQEASELLDLSPSRIYQLIEKHRLKIKYRRGVKVCRKSDILKLDKPTKSKFTFVDNE